MIAGYQAVVDPAKPACRSPRSCRCAARWAAACCAPAPPRTIPRSTEVHKLSGNFCTMLKIRVASMAHLEGLLERSASTGRSTRTWCCPPSTRAARSSRRRTTARSPRRPAGAADPAPAAPRQSAGGLGRYEHDEDRELLGDVDEPVHFAGLHEDHRPGPDGTDPPGDQPGPPGLATRRSRPRRAAAGRRSHPPRSGRSRHSAPGPGNAPPTAGTPAPDASVTTRIDSPPARPRRTVSAACSSPSARTADGKKRPGIGEPDQASRRTPGRMSRDRTAHREPRGGRGSDMIHFRTRGFSRRGFVRAAIAAAATVAAAGAVSIGTAVPAQAAGVHLGPRVRDLGVAVEHPVREPAAQRRDGRLPDVRGERDELPGRRQRSAAVHDPDVDRVQQNRCAVQLRRPGGRIELRGQRDLGDRAGADAAR